MQEVDGQLVAAREPVPRVFAPYDHMAYACTQEVAALQQEFRGASRGQAMEVVKRDNAARGSMIVHAQAGSLDARIEHLSAVASAFVRTSDVVQSGGDDWSQSWVKGQTIIETRNSSLSRSHRTPGGASRKKRAAAEVANSSSEEYSEVAKGDLVEFVDGLGKRVRGEVHDMEPGISGNPGIKVRCFEGAWRGKRRRVTQDLRVLRGAEERAAAELQDQWQAEQAGIQPAAELQDQRQVEQGLNQAEVPDAVIAEVSEGAAAWFTRWQALSRVSDEELKEAFAVDEPKEAFVVDDDSPAGRTPEEPGRAQEAEAQGQEQEQEQQQEQHAEACTVGERDQAANLKQNPAAEAMAVLTATALHVVETLAAAERSEKLD